MTIAIAIWFGAGCVIAAALVIVAIGAHALWMQGESMRGPTPLPPLPAPPPPPQFPPRTRRQ